MVFGLSAGELGVFVSEDEVGDFGLAQGGVDEFGAGSGFVR